VFSGDVYAPADEIAEVIADTVRLTRPEFRSFAER
jgi:hypothetical protein